MSAASDPRLYDATGTLIPLPGPAAPPKPSFVPRGVDYEVNDRYRDYISEGLTPGRIGMATKNADAGDPSMLAALFEEILEKDPKIQSVASTRKKAVLGLNWEVRPPELDDEHSDDQELANQIAKECDAAFWRARGKRLIGHIMEMVGKGIAVDWIDWDYDKETGHVVPCRFRRIPMGHLRWGNNDEILRVYAPSDPTTVDGEVGVPFPPYTTVRALDEEREDYPTRGGLLRTCLWYYLFKNTSIKDWVSLADRFGTPQRILSLDPGDFANSEMYEQARAALRSIGSSSSGVISTQWKLDIANAAAKGGADLFNTIIDYIDRAIAQLWLGHELTSQGSKGGGNLGISAAIQVRQDYLEGDCANITDVTGRDVFTPWVGWNYGWDKLHLVPSLQADYEPPRDLVAEANVFSTIMRTVPDFDASKQQLRDTYGIDAPLDEKDSITAGTAAPAGGDPLNTPDVPPGTPVVSVNAVNSAHSRSRRKRSIPKSSPSARQKKVDRLIAKGIKTATAETSKWQAKLRTMIREGVSAGLTIPQMAQRIARSYPDFDVDRLETQLQEQLVLVRLFGRNA